MQVLKLCFIMRVKVVLLKKCKYNFKSKKIHRQKNKEALNTNKKAYHKDVFKISGNSYLIANKALM